MDDYSHQVWMLEELADELETAATTAKNLGWGTTASQMKRAASSIRWQINWETRRPQDRADRQGRKDMA